LLSINHTPSHKSLRGPPFFAFPSSFFFYEVLTDNFQNLYLSPLPPPEYYFSIGILFIPYFRQWMARFPFGVLFLLPALSFFNQPICYQWVTGMQSPFLFSYLLICSKLHFYFNGFGVYPKFQLQNFRVGSLFFH